MSNQATGRLALAYVSSLANDVSTRCFHNSLCTYPDCKDEGFLQQISDSHWYLSGQIYPASAPLLQSKVYYARDLHDVPAEIIHNICGFLSREDLGSF